MHWPQVTMIVLLAASPALALGKHGEPSGKYNVWASLITSGITAAILIAGGFFK